MYLYIFTVKQKGGIDMSTYLFFAAMCSFKILDLYAHIWGP